MLYATSTVTNLASQDKTTKYRKTSDRSPRLLSVQMNQTPGLYAEPGVYHNMSTLCYFIQKSSTSVYQYLYFVYFMMH